MVYKKKNDFYLLRLAKGERVMESLMEIVKKEKIKTAIIQGLGGIADVKLAYFSLAKKKYIFSYPKGNLEMVSLIGNIIDSDKGPVIHVHVGLVDEKGKALGGHLVEAMVWATAEVFIQSVPIKAKRLKDQRSGLNLINFN